MYNECLSGIEFVVAINFNYMARIVLDVNSHRQGWVIAQTLIEPAVADVKLTVSTLYACGRWSLASIKGEVSWRSSLAIYLLALRLNNDSA